MMKQLDIEEGIELLKKNNIKFEGEVVSISEIIYAAKEYPVALKVAEDFVIHKTDSNAVRININSKRELIDSAREIQKSVYKKFRKKPEKFIVQKMCEGVELIIGVKKDLLFGHIIMFGIGGIFVELYKDVSFRSIPLTEKDAISMIEEIKGKKILEGIRGTEKINKNKVVELLLKVSNLVIKNPKIQEIDFNPIIANGNNLHIVDVRFMK
jgi:acyl-CoA synthetase (NDP forming)